MQISKAKKIVSMQVFSVLYKIILTGRFLLMPLYFIERNYVLLNKTLTLNNVDEILFTSHCSAYVTR